MKVLKWCGYTWIPDAKGRTIHPDQPWMWYSKDVIRKLDGEVLAFNLRKNPNTIEYDGEIYKPTYETPMLMSLEEFGYGVFSCEIQLPKGIGLWPAFWLSGSGNWPPEIDIMEAWSKRMNYHKCLLKRNITTNVHYNDNNMKHCDVKSKCVNICNVYKPTERFVEYKCKWEENKITFYIDNQIIREITGDVCKNLTGNLKHPEKGWKMNVIFDLWCEDPKKFNVRLNHRMYIRNFKYEKC